MEHFLVMPNVSRPCEIMFEAHLLLWRPHIFKLKMSFLGLIRGFYIEGALYGWLSISRIKVHLRPASSTAYGHQPHCTDKDRCLCLVRQCLLLNALDLVFPTRTQPLSNSKRQTVSNHCQCYYKSYTHHDTC